MRDGSIIAASRAAICGGLYLLLLVGLAACDRQEKATSAAKPLAFKSASAPVVIEMPKKLPAYQETLLYEALAGTELYAQAMRRKEETGFVVTPGKEKDLLKAKSDLVAIRAQIAELSKGGLPTYALLHSIDDNGLLFAFLLAPDGGMIADVATKEYAPLDSIADGLGVTRIAAARGLAISGEEAEPNETLRAARARDQTPEAKAERKTTLADARDMLLPSTIGAALGTRTGRLLIIPTRDTGTAPYAAMPLANGIAAQNWSFVVLSDIALLTQRGRPFMMADIDIDQAVIVGDPDLEWDKTRNGKPKWEALPGARKEAQTVAKLLGEEKAQLLMGADATRKNVVNAINSGEQGMVYLASHAIANPRFPLTQGYVALAGEHLYAGHIRQEKFRGWDKNHPLVILSACQTALGRTFGGGGFGVAKTWMTAGAGQVVASLWNVSDPATLDLMTRFMRHLKHGEAPEVAMQAAQLETMKLKNKKGEFVYRDDPKMWASFTVYGKPTADAKALH
jgi:CHAT domain-containing protein